MSCEWTDKIFSVNQVDFESLALEIFRFQYQHNQLYKQYADAINRSPARVTLLNQIPFLPISFFKTHTVQTTSFATEFVFKSSGTTQTVQGKHFIKDVALYEKSFTHGFEIFYGSINEWCIIGLLPSYLERNNSSLAFMVDKLIKLSHHPRSSFYLYDYEMLFTVLKELEEKKQKTLLIAVTFALLDFAKQYPLELKNTIIMETGGMKGRTKELIREEAHEFLRDAFGVSSIHSEYGMTELLSQAYSQGNGIFQCPPWMKVLIREEDDPLRVQSIVGSQKPACPVGRSGVMSRELGVKNIQSGTVLPTQSGIINVIDLANVYSCSFIATDDVGRLYTDGTFEVLGRMDNSDVRGCSLMVV